MVIYHGRQSRTSFQGKEREPCTPVLHSLAPQADTETTALLGHGDLLSVCSPLFQSVCQCLCCFTLCFPQRSWIGSPLHPREFLHLFLLGCSLLQRFFCASGLWEDSPHQGRLLCPKWQNLPEKQPLAQSQEQLQFLRTWHFGKRKYFEMLFLFPHWRSRFPEVWEQHLWGPGMCALHRGKNRAELSPETQSGHPLGKALLRLSWKSGRQCSEVSLCRGQVGRRRQKPLPHSSNKSGLYPIGRQCLLCWWQDKTRDHRTLTHLCRVQRADLGTVSLNCRVAFYPQVSLVCHDGELPH